MRRAIATGLACGALASVPSAWAGPITTPLPVLKQIIDRVVIGRVAYAGGKVAIDIEKVVFGDAPIGRLEVHTRRGEGAEVKEGERALLLLDREGALRYAGSLVAGPSLEEGAVLLRGFSDVATHVVDPGIVTLGQLDGYLRWGVLAQQVDATLAFPDGKGDVKASSSRFTISSDPIARTVGVMRLPAVCLEGRPVFGISSFANTISLRFGADCGAGKSPDVDRTLVLEGAITGVDPVTGAFRTELVPIEPFVNEKEFAMFAKDPAITGVEQAVGVRVESGAVWTWRLGVDLSPPAGPAVAASGIASGATFDTYTFGDHDLVIAPHARIGMVGGHARSILEIVDRGPVETCELRRPSEPALTCKLVRKPQRWVRIKR